MDDMLEFSPLYFGKNHTTTSCSLPSNNIRGAAGRWGGLNRPLAGFGDVSTQENQTTALACVQTAVSNTIPGLKPFFLLWEKGFAIFSICKTFSQTALRSYLVCCWLNILLNISLQTWLQTNQAPISDSDSNPNQGEEGKQHQVRISSQLSSSFYLFLLYLFLSVAFASSPMSPSHLPEQVYLRLHTSPYPHLKTNQARSVHIRGDALWSIFVPGICWTLIVSDHWRT